LTLDVGNLGGVGRRDLSRVMLLPLRLNEPIRYVARHLTTGKPR